MEEVGIYVSEIVKDGERCIASAATGAGVERESGQIISKLMDSVLSDIMFYKRWAARQGNYLTDDITEDDIDNEQEDHRCEIR